MTELLEIAQLLVDVQHRAGQLLERQPPEAMKAVLEELYRNAVLGGRLLKAAADSTGRPS